MKNTHKPKRRKSQPKLRGKALFRKAINHIIAHPEEFDQWAWIMYKDCRTTHCIGGWIDFFAGKKPKNDFDYDFAETGKLIGIDSATARWLFSSYRKFLAIYAFSKAFLGGKKSFTPADLRWYAAAAVKPL